MSDAGARERRQLVRYAFYKVDPAWRRLPPDELREQKHAFAAAVGGFRGRLLVRSYSLVGTRGDVDFLLWQVAEDMETLVSLQAELNRTRLAAHLTTPYSYLAVSRRSIYEIPAHEPGSSGAAPGRVQPGEGRYLFVYPFVKAREWYTLPRAQRQEMIEEHVAVGRRHPGFRLNTTYSYGLDDQEFVVAFEGDDPGAFLDMVMALRETRASRYTLRDTPSFSCVQLALADVLDTLGGEAAPVASGHPARRDDGFVPVLSVDELPPGGTRRVYASGEAVALFNVEGRLFALGNRCPHARGSLSEGKVDAGHGTVTCPWHDGRFALGTGEALSGPATAGVASYPVKVEGGVVLIGPASPPPGA
jgi:chlorite dismutase/nitrite reductase/ring-hydroxylating ferredoxin subunit